MWILLLLFPLSSFAVVVDSPEECLAVGHMMVNVDYEEVQAMCMPTVEI